MRVYAVMRGTELFGLYSDESDASNKAAMLNTERPRGKRYSVVPMMAKGEK